MVSKVSQNVHHHSMITRFQLVISHLIQLQKFNCLAKSESLTFRIFGQPWSCQLNFQENIEFGWGWSSRIMKIKKNLEISHFEEFENFLSIKVSCSSYQLSKIVTSSSSLQNCQTIAKIQDNLWNNTIVIGWNL